ncbi:MAG: 50S ribosomal protein L25/general stress protein Ctc [Planctomycetota bacterium]|jgi:large subunit ribosomal protein L25
MSMHAILKAEKRDARGKGVARKLRAAGRLPAVVYGQGGEALSITLDTAETSQLFHAISVENTIVDLSVEGEESFQTLVREIQVHPFRPDVMHVDFYRLQKGVKVDVEIPVHLIGTPVGVKTGGGILQQVVYELPVKVIPSMIPESFDIDVEAIEVGGSIHVSDLTLPEGVEEIGLDADQTICTVVLPRAVVAEDEEEGDEDAEGVASDEAAGDAG